MLITQGEVRKWLNGESLSVVFFVFDVVLEEYQ